MSLGDLQRATARILLDRDFEQRVRDQGASAFNEYTLTDVEQRSLMELDPERFAFSAWAARTKRGQLFWMCMPARLRQAIPEAQGVTLTTRFADQFPHVGIHPWVPNLARILHWLSGSEGARHGAAPQLQAIATYEKLRVLLPKRREAAESALDVRSHLRFAPHVAIARFPMDVGALLQRPPAQWGDVPVAPVDLCVSNERQGLFVLPASRMLRALQSLADGTRAVPELIAGLRRALNDESDALVTTLASFTRRGVLQPVEFWRPPA